MPSCRRRTQPLLANARGWKSCGPRSAARRLPRLCQGRPQGPGSRPLQAGSNPRVVNLLQHAVLPVGDSPVSARAPDWDRDRPGLALSKDLAHIALAGCVETCSQLRRDGRALRFAPDKAAPTVHAEFVKRTAQISDDLLSVGTISSPSESKIEASVLLGDGRDPTGLLPEGFMADLAVFSPPYPNNIDYTEVYKLENWFLRLIDSQATFRAQRLRTVRSHPSVHFSGGLPLSA